MNAVRRDAQACRVANSACAYCAARDRRASGNAVLARLAGWEGTAFGERLSLRYAANSRFGFSQRRARCGSARDCRDGRDADVRHVRCSRSRADAGRRGTRIVIDATASEAVADRHARWLSQGIHVVTACKLGQGTSLSRWHAIRDAQRIGGTRYGDSATVGAGLPLLRRIRALQTGGDRIHAIAGVLSGSLAWLFNHYDGLRPFSGFVRQARDAGYTEPDPRDDLSRRRRAPQAADSGARGRLCTG